jgi:hypothetical protein
MSQDQSPNSAQHGNIAINVTPQDGQFLCALKSEFMGHSLPSRGYRGQSVHHAIAIALEHLASDFRREAAANQKIDFDAVDRTPSGKVLEKRYHVILHYECVTKDESKFEAAHNVRLGNQVVENAEITVIQIDDGLPIDTRRKR